MNKIQLELPLTHEAIKDLKAGDLVSLSGVLYTARDAAHKRLIAALEQGEPLPIELHNQTIYYAGPCPAPPGRPIGSAGPTTSGRMDAYTPRLLEQGLIAMIGKGMRTEAVVQSIVQHGAIYFGATGGAGALLAQRILQATVVAYADLGAEAIRKLVVEDFPVVVLIDSLGNNLYESGPAAWAEKPRD
ncbi:MAG: Fe-S-containing hydro-lyase [Eubacteriales bacterium]|nr:Fe-S-containing hydro-lyase [Eubacteriales bacterium]